MNILDFSDEILVKIQGYLDKRSLYNFRISCDVGMRSYNIQKFNEADKKYKARIKNFENICAVVKNLSYYIDNDVSSRYNWEDTVVIYASYESLVELNSSWKGCLEKEIMNASCDLVIQNTINKRNKDIKNGLWLNYDTCQKINNRNYLPNGRSFGILVDEIDNGKVFTIYTRDQNSKYVLPEKYITGVDFDEKNEIFSLIGSINFD